MTDDSCAAGVCEIKKLPDETCIRKLRAEVIAINGVAFSFADIERVVDYFYRALAADEILKVPFSTVLDWNHHIELMTNFWWIKFGGKLEVRYPYNPIPKHFQAGFNDELLARWLGLFYKTLDNTLSVQQRDAWYLISESIGHTLTLKNELFKAQLGSSE